MRASISVDDSPLRAVIGVLRRDLAIALRRRADAARPFLFFLIVVALFPLATGASPARLALLAPGVVWVAALLATLLSLDRMFRTDLEDGSLDQLMLSPHPLPLLLAGKIAGHWLTTGLPLVLASPLLGILFALPSAAPLTLTASLALGTPYLSLVGAVGAALTAGLREAGLLLAIMMLPLFVPVLLFATMAVDVSATGASAEPYLSMLGALLALALVLAPWATGASLRVGMGG